MALRQIIKEPDPLLRKISRQVEVFDQKLWTLLDDMRETMHHNEGVGLAAPQVGVLRRVAIVEAEEQYIELINPEIIKASGEQTGAEGCLSVEDFNCKVKRPMEITVKAYDRYGKKFKLQAEGYLAVVCCHEIDHLNGILFIDRQYEPDEGEK